VLPNGDVLVAESNAPPKPPGLKNKNTSGIRGWFAKKMFKKAGAAVPSANRITLLRDADGDGVADVRTVFMSNLVSPFGMALVGSTLYVANADAVLRVPYKLGDKVITAAPAKLTDLPAGINHHWTKNIIASQDGSALFATVGSNSNVGENGLDMEKGRAAIWRIDLATGAHRIFASGLRNPNGLAWEPTTGALWTVVNERDELGSDLVPDYLTSVTDG
jgi:glucose/arabinose dehydrogenase